MSKNEQISFDLDENNLVVQSNIMIYANYDLSALEQKIVLILISTIKKTDKELNTLEFLVKDLAKILNVTPELLYRDLPKLCRNIMGKIIEVKKPNGSWEMFNIICYAQYKSKEGRVCLAINKKAEPYLLQLQEFFTSYKLGNALNLSGKYSIRIYQLTKGCLYKGNYSCTVEELKKMLKIDKKKTYDKFGKITEKILIPAIDEINNNSDINVDYDTTRVGRKIEYINFKITSKDKTNKKVSLKNNNYNEKGFNNFAPSELYNDKSKMKNLEWQLLGWDKDD